MDTIRPLAGRALGPTAALAAALAASLATAPAAPAGTLCPIDDFESGGFDHQSVAAYAEFPVTIPDHAVHAVSSERTIVLSPNGGIVHARATPGTSIDDFVTITVEAAGRVYISYDWGFPADLTFGGTVDEIRMRLRGPAGSLLSCGIGDGSSVTGSDKTLGPGPGTETVIWPISNWIGGTTDPTNATSLHFYFFAPPTAGDYEVDDIRFHSTGGVAVDFTGDFVATQTPPIPTPPLSFRLFDPSSNPIYAADVSIADAWTDAQTVMPGDWTWSESSALGGETALMTFRTTDPNIVETRFDIAVDVSSAGGWLPDLYPPDPVHDAESIVLTFPVAMRNGAGVVQGVSNTFLALTFDEMQGGSLEFQEVTVTENTSTARSWTDGFVLSFRMLFSGSGSPDWTFPLFHAQWLSDWDTQVPTGVAATAPPADGGLRLTAAPSVTRAATEIRATRPLDRAAAILIHDVTGRTVRTIAVPAGARTVRWDGRTAGGTAVPAGVYFARLGPGGGAGSQAARITLVR